jgi:hypothetical protein
MSAAVDIPGVQFLVYGSGDIGRLQRQAEKLGVDAQFSFRGYVDDIAVVLQEIDVFGYPLCEDTYAAAELILQEVMYAGIPPVVFPYGGVKELVIDDYTGLVVSSAKEYVQALRYLFDHPEEKARLGNNAREYAAQIFGAENAAKKINRHYFTLLQQPKRTRCWGVDPARPLISQRVTIGDVLMSSESSNGADAFLRSLGEYGQDYYISKLSSDPQSVFAAEARISRSSPSMVLGGIRRYRNFYINDAYLRLWNGLAYMGEDESEAAMNEMGAAIDLGLKEWRIFWYIALEAKKIGQGVVAKNAAQEVLALNPRFSEAEKFLTACG